jgi:hypothetical protein
VNAFALLGAVSGRLRPSEIGSYEWDDKAWTVSIGYEEVVGAVGSGNLRI